MRTVRLIDNIDYPEEVPDPAPAHHLLMSEWAERTKEMGSVAPKGNGSVVRIMRQLAKVHKESERAYLLILDVLSNQQSLEQSLADLAAKHTNSKGQPCTRQNWLQNMQADVEIIKLYLPEWGTVLESIMQRRRSE